MWDTCMVLEFPTDSKLERSVRFLASKRNQATHGSMSDYREAGLLKLAAVMETLISGFGAPIDPIKP